MERFVRLTAPTGKPDFLLKLVVFVLICGVFNHVRHLVTYGLPGNKSFWVNLSDASFTALPMCAFALMLIGHLDRLQRQLYLQATRDPLTDLPNRRWFMDRTPHTIAPSQAVMMIDVDHFKDINDVFGHDTGDHCLQQMGRHLLACIEEDDLLARIGGEEFAALIVGADDAKLDRIATKMSAGITFDTRHGVQIAVSVSVGIGRDRAMVSRTDALRAADRALYQAKSAGRAQYRICANERRENRQDSAPFVIAATQAAKRKTPPPDRSGVINS